MSWLSEFFTAFVEALKDKFHHGDIGEKINEAIMQVQNYFEIGDVKVVITDAVIVTWISVAIMIVLVTLLIKTPKLIPGKGQTVLEMLIGLMLSVAEGFGLNRKEAKHIAPMIATICIVITGCNCISLFGVAPPAKNIGFPIGMALVAIFYVIYVSIRFVGFKGFWASLTSPIPFLLPFKILDMCIKPCSLALRLFGNIFGGFVFMEFIHIVIPIIVPGILSLWFDLADAILQAVVFTYLTIYYIGEIVEVGHEYNEHPEKFKKQKKAKKVKKAKETNETNTTATAAA